MQKTKARKCRAVILQVCRRYFSSRTLWHVVGVGLVFSAVVGMAFLTGIVIDFASQNPDLLIAGAPDQMDSIGADLVMGDLDGDGNADLVVGSPWAGKENAAFVGRLSIFWGSAGLAGMLSPEDAAVTILGANVNDMLGGGLDRMSGTLAIGRINEDALDDLVVGIPDAQSGTGQVHIFWGRSRAQWQATPIIDLATTPGDVVITGVNANDAFGSAVAMADLTGDGRGDVIVGAPRADGIGNNVISAGETYIFFGRETWATPLSAATDADVRIIGEQSRDFLGSGLAVGQLGGSDLADVAIGSLSSSGGSVYVIFGSATLPQTWDLLTMPADWIVRAADMADEVGRHLAIGDVSGDGQPDLVLGVPGGDGPDNNRVDAGETVVLLGPRPSGTRHNLAAGVDFIIYGAQGPSPQESSDRLGDGLALGDFNGDGIQDILVGARQGDGAGNARTNAGEAYVIFGGQLPATLDLSTLAADIILYGGNRDDFMGRTAAGNLDGIPPDDIALGAHRAQDAAGAVFVVYQQAVVPTPTATATPAAGSLPTPTSTPTVVTPTSTPQAPQFNSYMPLILLQAKGGLK